MQLYRTVIAHQTKTKAKKSKIKTKTGAVFNHSPASACFFDVACGR